MASFFISVFHLYFRFSIFTYKIRGDLKKTIEQIIIQIIHKYGKVMTIESQRMICGKLAHLLMFLIIGLLISFFPLSRAL